MNEKVVNAALLGLGTVGTGVYKVIKSQEQEMTAKLGCQVKITKILVRNLEKASGKVDDPSVLTTDWADIEGDPSSDIVIELIGGIEPARTYILAALKAGKNVVTANKDLIAVHGKEILEPARAAQKDFLFEAAVAGGIPIISPLKNSLEANHVTEVMGIVNGTTNFILTKMSQEGMEFSDALALATELGYAEADPTADIEGIDAGRKVAILGDMGELGTDEAALHEGVGVHAGQCRIDACICVGPLAAHIAEKASQTNPDLTVIREKDLESLLKNLNTYVKPGDTILVKASHFMKFENVVKALQEM